MRWFAPLSFVAALALAAPIRAGSLEVVTGNPAPGKISVAWTFTERADLPVVRPDWVGYDVMRRAAASCGAVERVNDEIFPRTVGATHGHSLTDAAPAEGVAYEYRVVPVDAARNPVTLGLGWCDPCADRNWASSPTYSAPLTVGTILGGGLLDVSPCPSTCFPVVYVDVLYGGAEQYLKLVPYADTGTVVRLFGRIFCGTTEGCAIVVDHFDLQTCDSITPTRGIRWGSLKTLYR